MKAVLLQQVAKIQILDSPIEGTIFFASTENHHLCFCNTREIDSPIFEAQKEAEIYHACRDWFMEQYDGFVTVEKIDNFQEDSEFFKDFKNRMKQEGYLKVTVRNPDREL